MQTHPGAMRLAERIELARELEHARAHRPSLPEARTIAHVDAICARVLRHDEDLAHALTVAGQTEGEPVWRMPLGAAYDKLIDTPNADMKNIAGKPVAGSIVGAQFIKRFVKDGTPWAHIDIAGTAWKPGPYEDPINPAWATGYGVRLLNRLIQNRYEE